MPSLSQILTVSSAPSGFVMVSIQVPMKGVTSEDLSAPPARPLAPPTVKSTSTVVDHSLCAVMSTSLGHFAATEFGEREPVRREIRLQRSRRYAYVTTRHASSGGQ